MSWATTAAAKPAGWSAWARLSGGLDQERRKKNVQRRARQVPLQDAPERVRRVTHCHTFRLADRLSRRGRCRREKAQSDQCAALTRAGLFTGPIMDCLFEGEPRAVGA